MQSASPWCTTGCACGVAGCFGCKYGGNSIMTNKTIEKITRWLQEHCDRKAALCLDSRHIESGDVFVARAGHHTDGYRFIQAAIDNGAAAVIYDAAQDRKSTRLNSSH